MLVTKNDRLGSDPPPAPAIPAAPPSLEHPTNANVSHASPIRVDFIGPF
jgi:hypothetical protein